MLISNGKRGFGGITKLAFPNKLTTFLNLELFTAEVTHLKLTTGFLHND